MLLSSVSASSLLVTLIVCLPTLEQVHALATPNWTTALLGSRSCVKNVVSKQEGNTCVKPVCGPLNTTGIPFEDRLTPSCKSVMNGFVARDFTSEWPASMNRDAGCTTFSASQYPTNPIVVQTKLTRSFGFCSVPKAACSQLRSLLFVMTRYPEPVSWIGEMWRVHMQSYPSLYHFEVPQPIPNSFPTFILGRSPYTRLLSGFLDKMTVQDRGNDMFTLQVTNAALGRGEADFFEDSKESFRDFLTQIIAVMKTGTVVNEHFAPMVSVCNVREVQYHYFLRLEDMTKWMPCLRDALQLGTFTDLGWDHDRTLRSDWYKPYYKGCWWRPKGMSCKEYMQQSRDFVQGYRTSIEVPQSNVPSGSAADVHQTSANDKLALYYDQEVADMVYDAYRIDFEAFGYERLVM